MEFKYILKPLCLIVCVSVFSCSVPKQTTLTKSVLPETFNGQKADTLAVTDFNWKTYFQDKYLIQLIDTALLNNYDAQMAIEQIEMANAYYKMSRGALYPTAEIGTSAKYGKSKEKPDWSSDYSIGLNSSWEIDLWGKLRSTKKAARARLLASQSGKQLIQTTIISEVSQAYYELLAFDSELEIMEKNIRLQKAALDIVRVQKQAGKATDLAVQQFEAQLFSSQAQKNSIQQLIIASENYLNRLLNRLPQPVARSKSSQNQLLPDILSAGVPFQLLRNRPDVKEASLLLEAAGFDLKAAGKAFLPTLKIQPVIGFDAARLKNGSFVFESVNGLFAPILQQNLLKGNYRIMQSQQRQAWFSYEKTVKQSISEVQMNLDKLATIEQEIVNRKNEVDILEKAVNTATDLYAYGYATYLEVINAQKSAREAELALTNIQKEKNQTTIDLYRAIGGGK